MDKTIDGFFFGGFDTVFSSEIQHLSENDCWRMQKTKLCGENNMVEDGGHLSYTSFPNGEGVWMQKKTYKSENCMIQKIMIKKDCIDCPITSPFGILKALPNDTFVMHQDSVIVWNRQIRDLASECKIKELRNSTGTISKLDYNTYKLVDRPGQLDYIYKEDTFQICNLTLHKLKNIDGTFIQIQNKNWSHIYNLETGYCLNPLIKIPSRCDTLPAGQFRIKDNKLNVIPKNNSDTKICIAMSPFLHQIDECSNLYSLKWNPNTLEITGKERCLQMNDNSSVSMNFCTGANKQKWIFGMPEINFTSNIDAKEPLLLRHHQFIEDQSVINENVIENELKRIYCNNLQSARYTTTLIAESSGLLAARANNLPLCHRLKPLGDYFLIQKCISMEIRVEAKQTRCGFEPYYENQTIGRDGFSLHPFSECFWEDGIVNLNGKTYRWKQETREWIFVETTHHQETLR